MAPAIIVAAPPEIVDMAGAGIIYLEVRAVRGSGAQPLLVAAALMAHILRPDQIGVATKPHGCREAFQIGEVAIAGKLSRRRIRRRAEGRSDFGTSRPAEATPAESRDHSNRASPFSDII